MDYDLKTKPDFGEMPMAWLIRTNNAMVREIAECGLDGHREVKVFHDRSAGVRRCESTWSSLVCARENKKAKEAEQKKPAPAAWPPETAPAKTRAPRQSSGKPAKSVAEFKTVRAGTARAKILRLIDGSSTLAEVASAVGLDAAKVAAHLYCTWRDCGIGYRLDDGKVTAVYPEGKSYDTTVVT